MADNDLQGGNAATVGPVDMNWKLGIMLGIAVAAGGCFTRDPISLDNDNPADSIPAIKAAADRDDRKSIPRLVNDLDDDDSAVRFAAITALEKMTGQTFDYRYYDPSAVRRPAVQRWRDWVAEQK